VRPVGRLGNGVGAEQRIAIDDPLEIGDAMADELDRAFPEALGDGLEAGDRRHRPIVSGSGARRHRASA
jgi:hypothetical protein